MFWNNLYMIAGQLRLQDILDIAIVSVMIAVILIWFRQRASRFVLVGLGLIGTIYALAIFFHLYLTTALLRGFFAIIIFVLVVIFQEDIRRLFERLALWGFFRKRFSIDDESSRKTADILIQTVESLARKRIGALIVISGDGILERHLSGGTVVNGEVSQSLLESIFDPGSPGHDGAVILTGNILTRFGCRLPLSTHPEDYKHLGLRHIAALGLAERTDALCIVVSEERGTITIAEGEKLRELPNASALGSALDRFYTAHAPRDKRGNLLRWLRENQKEKVIALSVACLLWVFFGYQREAIRRDFTVPISFRQAPVDWFIADQSATAARVTLSGSFQAFRLFNPEHLQISLDLSRLRRGANEFVFTGDMITTPSGMTVIAIKPDRIRLTATPMIAVNARVTPVTEGKPAAPFVLERISVTPQYVRILAPPNAQGTAISVPTEPVNLAMISGNEKMQRKINLPPGMFFPDGKIQQATVSVMVRKRRR